MKLFEDFKAFIQKRLLNKITKEQRSKTEFHNLDTAKIIHLFFDARTKENYLPVKTFISELKDKNIRVSGIGLTETDEQKANFLFHKEVQFVSKKETNWLGKPPKEALEQISRERADIFLNLSCEDLFTGRYITAYSEAKFKISGLPNDCTADFIIDVSKNKSQAYLIEQSKHFLSTIKKA